jgi:squalene-hopene/tetraprenyl-beta-curcumene cyclase
MVPSLAHGDTSTPPAIARRRAFVRARGAANALRRCAAVPIVAAAAGALFALPAVAGAAANVPTDDRALAEEVIVAARAYLLSQQDAESGGWRVPSEGENRPHLPAITGLIVNGMLLGAERDSALAGDAQAQRAVDDAVAYLLSHSEVDGGIYDRILAAYNTAISVSALARIDSDEARAAVRGGVDFLREIQWHESSTDHPETGRVPRAHAFYGGVGYGGSSRPDNSNLNFFVQALHDAGVPSDDPAYQRALVFLARTQMLDSVNDMDYADGSRQGGFIYATSPTGEQVGVGESKAGTIVETLSDGTTASRLRSYGSMTYAGFKSYIYADLPKDDERVAAALGWIADNYTLDENPGIGTDGYYYYLIMFGRALDAWGADALVVDEQSLDVRYVLEAPQDAGELPIERAPTVLRSESGVEIELEEPAFSIRFDDPATVEVPEGVENGLLAATQASQERAHGRLADGRAWRATDVQSASHASTTYGPDGTETNGLTYTWSATFTITDERAWRSDLINKLAELQREDGSFRPVDDRWMEDDPVLITAYCLIAIEHALGAEPAGARQRLRPAGGSSR